MYLLVSKACLFCMPGRNVAKAISLPTKALIGSLCRTDLTRHVERFLNPLLLFHISIRERANRKHLGVGGPFKNNNSEGD